MAIVTIEEDQASFTGDYYGVAAHKIRRFDANFKDAPKDVLLLYMRILPGVGFEVTHLGDKVGDEPVDGVITRLIEQARGNDRLNVVGLNFEKLVFNTPTYVALVFDERGWDFYRDLDTPGANIVVFRQQKALGPGGLVPDFDKNFAFSDLRRVEGADCPAVVMINFHCSDENGTPVKDQENLKYCFDINLRLPFVQAGTTKHITIIIDPTGENQGPRPPGL